MPHPTSAPPSMFHRLVVCAVPFACAWQEAGHVNLTIKRCGKAGCMKSASFGPEGGKRERCSTPLQIGQIALI